VPSHVPPTVWCCVVCMRVCADSADVRSLAVHSAPRVELASSERNSKSASLAVPSVLRSGRQEDGGENIIHTCE
jgi:hypothetical protein